ncbi:MFS transporter [Rhodovulum sp. DZ06]|uniref:MFS transporter n=1 Tax=Rhodovulum sp. DZ06 TaxID=3425126 RepID=UPI003D355F81
MSILPHDGPAAWRRLGLGMLASVVGNAGMWSIVTLMPGVEAEFALDRAAASMPYTLTMAGFGLGSVMIGRAVDRLGFAAALGAAGVLLGLAYMAAWAAPSAAMLAAAQFFIGLGTACTFAPLIADISRWFNLRRGLAIALAACGNYLAGAVWPPILAAIMGAHDWRAACLALAAASVIALPLLALAMRGAPPAEPAPATTGRAAERARTRTDLPPRTLITLLCIAGFACCMAMAMPQVHIVALCVDYGYGPAVGAEMLSLMLLGGCASRILSGFAADRFGGAPTLLVGSTLQMLALILFIPFDALAPLYMVSLTFGLAQGGIVPAYAVIVRERLPAKDAGTQVGIVVTATLVGMAAGGWASGWIFDLTGSYQAAFLHGIGWNWVNMGIVALLIWRSRPARGPAPAA